MECPEDETAPESSCQQEMAAPNPAVAVEDADEDVSSDPDEWVKLAILGQGATGEVSVWENRRTNQKLAIKISTRRRISSRQFSYWTSEVMVMNKLRHVNVVRGYALPDGLRSKLPCVLTPLAMEYCSGGSLRKFLESYRQGVPEDELRNILKDICAGLRYLHRKHIIHRDIKPDNIVIQNADRFIYKITDLGYMKILERRNNTRSLVGTQQYGAPEVFNAHGLRKYNYLVDYWSLGITIFEVATGFRPFREITVCPRKPSVAIWARRTILGVEYMTELPARCHFTPAFRCVLTQWLRTMLQFYPARRNPDPLLTPLDFMIRFIAITENPNINRLPQEENPDLNGERENLNERAAGALGENKTQKFKTM